MQPNNTQSLQQNNATKHQKLCHFIQMTLKSKNAQTYHILVEELDCYTKYKPDSVKQWYLALSDSIECLSLNENKELRQAIFEHFRWDFPFETLEAYCIFCCNLISSDATFTEPVLLSCIKNFTQNPELANCPPTIEIDDKCRFGMIHQLLQRLHLHRPRISTKILQIITDTFPKIYKIRNDNECIITFIDQLFVLINYIPELKDQILQLIIERMINIDTEASKIAKINLQSLNENNLNENIEETKFETNNIINNNNNDNNKNNLNDNDSMSDISSSDDESNIDENGNDNDMDIDIETKRNMKDEKMDNNNINNKSILSNIDEKMDENIIFTNLKIVNPMAYIIDKLMIKVFKYMDDISSKNNSKLLDQLFSSFCRIFEKTVLSTIECHHVQYTMFYLCHLKPSFSETFVQRLLKVCTDTKTPQHERCFAAAYVGGFVSKAKYLRHATCITTFEILLQWALAYIDLYNRNFPFDGFNISIKQAKNHPLFYSACQAIFRIYIFHQIIIEAKWKIDSKVSDIYKLVQCCLQPIKFSNKDLVSDFTESVKHSKFIDIKLFPQSGYHYTSKSFASMQICPFDDYALPVSWTYIANLVNDEEDDESEMIEEDDDDDVENETLTWANKIDPEMALTPTISAEKPPNTHMDDLDDVDLDL